MSTIEIVCCRACKSHPIIRISASFDPSLCALDSTQFTRIVVRPTSLCHQPLLAVRFCGLMPHHRFNYDCKNNTAKSGCATKKLSRASRRGVQGMQIVHEPFVEGIRRVDVDAIGGDDVVVLEANAADAGLPRVGLEIERHPFL